jgi:hypothetical protein
VTAVLQTCWPRCMSWSNRLLRSFGVGWVLLLEEELEGLDSLLDGPALCDFVKRLVLLLDVVIVLVVDVNICALYICETFMPLDCDTRVLEQY